MDLGVPPFLISAIVIGVLAQKAASAGRRSPMACTPYAPPVHERWRRA
jgi:hypothetical protein